MVDRREAKSNHPRFAHLVSGQHYPEVVEREGWREALPDQLSLVAEMDRLRELRPD